MPPLAPFRQRRPASSQRPARERHAPLVHVWRWRIATADAAMPFNWALAVGDAVMDALGETARSLSGSGLLPVSLHGPSDPRERGWTHGHAFVLSEDADGDGVIDHIAVSAAVGLDPRALRLLAATDRIRLSNGTGAELVTERVVPLAALPTSLRGPARAWISRTAYVAPNDRPRFDVRDAIRQLRHEIGKRGLAARLAAPPEPVDVLHHAGEALPADAFHTERDNGGRLPEGARPAYFRLTFEREVAGPLAFGWSSHRGLGLFVPADRGQTLRVSPPGHNRRRSMGQTRRV
jgi:CRISPR-associated protein Csb2